MHDPLRIARLKAAATYNAAADAYRHPQLAFWDRCGRATVGRLALRPGMCVLDVCCGAGASALPAAAAVGSGGTVVGIDLAADLLALGRARAIAAGYRQLAFCRGDMTALPCRAGVFDAVICVFGIFFAPDMERQVATFWQFLKPGGQLAITTWGPAMFAPAYDIWLSAVRRTRPDLDSGFKPWDRITTAAAVRQMFAAGGVDDVVIAPEQAHQPLRNPDDFWTVARGSGLRWTIDQMAPAEAAAVRREIMEELEARNVDRIATNIIHAIARKPAS